MNADQEQKDMQQALERFGSYMRNRQFLVPLEVSVSWSLARPMLAIGAWVAQTF